MRAALPRVVLYVVIILTPLGLIAFLGSPAESPVYQTGRHFALVGFMILCLQGFLAGRIKWAERPFGLDILVRYHRYMALLGLLLLAAHPVLLAAGGAGWRLLFELDLPWYIWIGKGVLVAVVIQVGVSMWQGKLGLKFERWRMGHDFLAVFVLAAAFVHSGFAGHDLEHIVWLKILWVGALAVTLLFLFYHGSWGAGPIA